MKKRIKKIICFALIVASIMSSFNLSYAATTAGQEMRTQVLYLCDIIENDNRMNEPVTRAEFSRMIVKASKYKDMVNSSETSSAFNDVPVTNPYAVFAKIACREGYMSAYLTGLFKPDEYVTYKDLIRGCLALLGYANSDFSGSQVAGRYEMFCSLKMNDNIEKSINDFVTKKDCVNGIYNTLKTYKKDTSTAYGPTIFTKMSVNTDGDLNASGLIKTKLEGPFILKKGGEALNLALPFDMTSANIFINGISQSLEEVMRELNNSGYLIYYYNKTTKTVYLYKEGKTLESSTLVKKGYVNHIYYSASDTVTPTKVEIDLAYYKLDSSEVQFAFSYAGTLHVGDQVIIIYTKSSSSSDDSSDDENQTIEGTISYACLYDLRY